MKKQLSSVLNDKNNYNLEHLKKIIPENLQQSIYNFVQTPIKTDYLYYFIESMSFKTSVYCIWNTNCENNSTNEWYKLAKDTTLNSLKYNHLINNLTSYNNNFIVDDDIDVLLTKAVKLNKSLAVVSVPGTYFLDKFALSSAWVHFLQDNKISLLGHLLNENVRRKGSYTWRIHPQFFVVNLEIYKELNCPLFNELSSNIVNTGTPNAKSVHDDYTPIDVKPGESVVIDKEWHTGYGSNFINESLQNGFYVSNIPKTIRDYKKFEYCVDNKYRKGYKSNFDLHNRLLLTNFYGGWDYVYCFNTESFQNKNKECVYTNFTNTNDYNTIWTDNVTKFISAYTVDSYISVSSGFVGDHWNYLFNFDADEMCYFDINMSGLSYKKFILQFWEGPKYKKLGDFLYEYASHDKSLLFQLLNIDPPADLIKWKSDINLFMDKVFEAWSINSMQEYLDKVKKSKQWYIHTDLIHTPRIFDTFSMLRRENYQLIFASNIFDNRLFYYQYNFDLSQIKNKVDNFFNSLPSKTIFIGTNFTNLSNDKKISAILVKE